VSLFSAKNGNISSYTLIVEPLHSFSSSSSGASGSLNVFARKSKRERETIASYTGSHDDASIELLTDALTYTKAKNTGSSIYAAVNAYVSGVEKLPTSRKNSVAIDVYRHTPTTQYTVETGLKHAIKNLGAFARLWNANATLSYTNYHCLNFFTGSNISTSSVLLYPSLDRNNGSVARGDLVPSGAFSIDFRINPCYAPESATPMHAGTLLHLSSCFAVSIVSGSGRDASGRINGYRILLQLSSSADVSPSQVNLTSLPNMTFLSADNSLKRNAWQRISIRWGSVQSNYSGSIDIDGVTSTQFVINSSSIAPPSSVTQPYVMCFGNYYNGPNSGTSSQAYFFATDVAEREGLETLINVTGVDEPVSSSFTHPLQAEVHDVCYYERWVTDAELAATTTYGFDAIPSGCFLCVPPFFTKESPQRKNVGSVGGVFLTPFQQFDGTTSSPINAELALGVDGHMINLENFVRDFALSRYPRLYHLTASVLATTTQLKTANEFLDTQYTRLANLLIMPCDDGSYIPSYKILSELDQTMFQDELHRHSESQIRLTDLISSASLLFDFSQNNSGSAGDIINGAIGPSPENVSVKLGPASVGFISGTVDFPPLTIFQRLRDGDSPRLIFFELDRALYGSKISPKSLTISDANMSGSSHAFGITLKDDGFGNIYRADASGSHATWSSVGHVFYDEGMIVIKSPHLWRFGEQQYSLSWRGMRPIYVIRYDAVALPETVNSSSNPTYSHLKTSNSATEPLEPNVYIGGVVWLDSKLNVVMRSKLAQPVLKRAGSAVTIRHKIDY
jgi:hypothetical protein